MKEAIKNIFEFDKFLGGLWVQAVRNKSQAQRFKALGISASQWPEQSIHKEEMRSLEFLMETKGHEFIRRQMGSTVKSYELEVSKIPDDDLVLKIIYRDSILYHKAIEIANNIAKNPESVKDQIKSFTQVEGFGVALERLSDNIERVCKKQLELIKENKQKIIIPDFEKLSNAIGGFNPGRITIFSAASGFGKTKFAINLANSASKIMPVIYCNMEMGKDDIVPEFFKSLSGASSDDWNNGEFVKYNLPNDFNLRNEIFFTDGQTISLSQICALIVTHSSAESPALVVVDYDQKINTESREEEWMALVRAVEKLENISKTSNAHVLLLAQADDHGDIKASKRAKQPASCVLTFTKDEQITGDRYYIRNIKNRFGKTGFCLEMYYDPARTKIREGDFFTIKERGLK